MASNHQPSTFAWLMTQEHRILGADATENPTVKQQRPVRPFTQVDFPSFTQLVAEDESAFKIPDPYKPPPRPKNPEELSELAWKKVFLLPDKEIILADLVGVLENTQVSMKNWRFKIFLKDDLVSTPFKRTFLSKCRMVRPDESSDSSSSSSSSSDSSDETDSIMSIDEEETHPILMQQQQSLESGQDEPIEADISNDLDLTSSEDEATENSNKMHITPDATVAEKFISPELPTGSQTSTRFDMPNIEDTATVATQTDLTMDDIEKLLKGKPQKESQQSRKVVGAAGEQQNQRRRKKSLVRVGLPKRKNSKDKIVKMD